MHPDNIIAALRDELARLDKSAEDYEQRKASIEAELKATDKLDRPAALPENPDVIADPHRTYLDALEDELGRAEKGRHGEIREEIKRVESAIKAKLGMDKPAPGPEPDPAPESPKEPGKDANPSEPASKPEAPPAEKGPASK